MHFLPPSPALQVFGDLLPHPKPSVQISRRQPKGPANKARDARRAAKPGAAVLWRFLPHPYPCLHVLLRLYPMDPLVSLDRFFVPPNLAPQVFGELMPHPT